MIKKRKLNIAQLREKRGLTQRQLAAEIGVAQKTISNWEVGRYGFMMIDTVVNLCQALDCKPEDLIS